MPGRTTCRRASLTLPSNQLREILQRRMKSSYQIDGEGNAVLRKPTSMLLGSRVGPTDLMVWCKSFVARRLTAADQLLHREIASAPGTQDMKTITRGALIALLPICCFAA